MLEKSELVHEQIIGDDPDVGRHYVFVLLFKVEEGLRGAVQFELLVDLRVPIVHGLDQAQHLGVLLEAHQGIARWHLVQELLHGLFEAAMDRLRGHPDVLEFVLAHEDTRSDVQGRCLSDELAQGKSSVHVRPQGELHLEGPPLVVRSDIVLALSCLLTDLDLHSGIIKDAL